MTKALVTGAAGFIGSHVVRELGGAGVGVRALLRPGEARDNLRGLDVELIEGDLLDRAAVDAAMRGVDQLFHLAAIYAIWMPDWGRMYEVNLQGARNVLWSALEHRVERVVFTSSIAAIGVAPGKTPSAEDTPFNQYTLGHHYVLTKYLAQQEALAFAAHGLDLVVVNPTFPFGERDVGPTPTGQLIIDIVRGRNRFHFDGGINIVDVADVARGHLLAATRGRRGRCYILGNQDISVRDFTMLVAGLAGRSPRGVVGVPVPLAKLTAHGLRWYSDHVSRRPPLSSPVEVAYASSHLYVDSSRARTELGWSPSPIEPSLRRAIEWFRANGYA